MSQTEAALFQGRSFTDIGQTQRAVDVLSAALEHDPGNVALLGELARAHVLLGDDEAATRAAEAAQTAAGAPVQQAMLVLVRVAYHQGRFHDMCELARSVVAQWPDAHHGHMAYALGLTRLATTDQERATVRVAAGRALELGQRSPSLLLNAAWIESRFGDKAACLAYVDEGLADDPSNADLLKLRAWAMGSDTYRASVMLGILAIDPFDTEASQSLEADVAAGRGHLLRTTFLAPFLLSLAVLLPPVSARTVALIAVTAFLARSAQQGVRFLASLPPVYRRTQLDAQLRLAVASLASSVVGAALFALDVVVGPALVAAGMVSWGVSTVVGIQRRVRAEPDGSDAQAMVRRAHGARMPVLALMAIVVGGISWFVAWVFLSDADAGAISAPSYLVVLLCSIVVMTAAFVLARHALVRRDVGVVVVSSVFAILAAGSAVAAGDGVVRSMSGSAAGHYAPLETSGRPCGRRNLCAPEFTAPTPQPVPSIDLSDLPTFEAPEFEMPEIPDLETP